MTLTSPKAVIFDWDNTLVDSWPVIRLALNNTLTFMGHEPWSAERVKRDVKKSMRDSFPELFGERWEVAADKYQQEYRAIHLDALQGLPDAEATLQLLRDAGLFVSIVSNKRGPTLRKELDKLAWNPYFASAVGSQDAERDKPDVAPAHLALKEFGQMQGPEIWFIGDTGADLECAKNLGATAILYGDFDTDGKTHDGFPFVAHARTHEALQALFSRYIA